MNYKEFLDKLGKISIPRSEILSELVEGQDSIHYLCVLGTVDGGSYKISEPMSDKTLIILETIEILESRGAVRDVDYIVTCYMSGEFLMLGIHSTHAFLSDDDFSNEVRRLNYGK